MSKKVQRALYGPSWAEVIIGAILSLVLGVILAAVYLVLKPVETVRELPKEPVRGMVYYREGSKDSSRARQWTQKRQMFLAGQSVVLTEEELNAAVASTDKSKAAPATPASDGILTPGAPNFRIENNRLQIGVPCAVNILGLTTQLPVVAAGGFEKQGERFVFDPETFYIGSLAVSRIPVLEHFMIKKIMAAQSVPEDLAAAWSKVSEVTVDGKTLRLTM